MKKSEFFLLTVFDDLR